LLFDCTGGVYLFEAPPADGKKVVGTPTPATNAMPHQRLRSIPQLKRGSSKGAAWTAKYVGLGPGH